MLRAGTLARIVCLLLAGTLAVHELRYRLAFGADADEALRTHGHEHLVVAGPILALLLALGFGLVVLRAATATAGASPRRLRLTIVWPLVSASLLASYVGQELLESVLAPGHTGGLAGVLGDGGWIAPPAAGLVGGLITLSVRAGDAVGAATAQWMAGLGRRTRPVGGVERATCAACDVVVPRSAPLARLGAGRAPPAAVA